MDLLDLNKFNNKLTKILSSIFGKISCRELINILKNLKDKNLTFEKLHKIFDLILENFNNIMKYLSNSLIKEQLYDLLNYLIDTTNFDYKSNESILNDVHFCYLLSKIICISLYNNTSIKLKYNFLLFQNIHAFLLDIKKKVTSEAKRKIFKQLLISIFKSFFIELFDDANNNDIMKKIEYVYCKKEIKHFLIKALNEQKFTYLSSLILLITSFDPILEIINDLNFFFEKIFELFMKAYRKEKNKILNNKKISINDGKIYFALCNFIHIFRSKEITYMFYFYLIEYLNNTNINDTIIFLSFPYLPLIIANSFYLCKKPFYFSVIKSLYKSQTTNNEKYLNELIEVIINLSQITEIKNNTIISNNNFINYNIISEENNFYFYYNTVYLVKLFYFLSKEQNVINYAQYEIHFSKIFEFLQRQKMLLSPYLIRLDKSNEKCEKTILEICLEIILAISNNNTNNKEIKYNFFNYITNNQNKKISLLFLFDILYLISKSKKNLNINVEEYLNKSFDTFLSNLNSQKEEKSLLLVIINYIIQIKNNVSSEITSETINTILDEYLENFINQLIQIIKAINVLKKIKSDEYYYNSEIEQINNININELTSEKLLMVIEEFQTNIKNIPIQNNIVNKKSDSFNKENKKIKRCYLNNNCLLLEQNNVDSDLNSSNPLDELIIVSDYYNVEQQNIILKIKPDFLLKDVTIYFDDIYFEDKNFQKIRGSFLNTYKKYLVNDNFQTQKLLNYPSKIKNFNSSKYATPRIFLTCYTNFYKKEYFNVCYDNLNLNLLKTDSFPYFLSHNSINDILKYNENNKIESFDCELIRIKNAIFGSIILYTQYLMFQNKENLGNYLSDMKYAFSSGKNLITTDKKLIFIKYIDIEEIITRSFLYNYQAFEIFLKNGKSYFFNLFNDKNLKLFYEEIEKIKNQKTNLKFPIIESPKKFFESNLYSKQWENNEISTYQYLLYLNKYSGRTYNDPNQYPIFPWIFLPPNLPNILNLRKLDFFILTQDEEGIKKALQSFKFSKKDFPNNPVHFRTHYSTGSYVFSYLIRIFPYTDAHIKLQAGSFNSPNRIANDIYQLYETIKKHNDNRELIPEFFSTCDFLYNLNYLRLGVRSSKILVNNYKIPDKFSSLGQFIYYHRLILNNHKNKNKYMKSLLPELKINKWIDLIFGYLIFPISEEKLNGFDKYSYRNKISLPDKINVYIWKKLNEEEMRKKLDSKIDKILNFGQCPEQLFNIKHNSYFGAKIDYLDISQSNKFLDFRDKIIKNIKIITFWLSENSNYIFFLAKENDEKINKKYMKIIIFDDKLNKRADIFINKIKIFNQKNNNLINNKILKKGKTEDTKNNKRDTSFASFVILDDENNIELSLLNSDNSELKNIYLLDPKDAIFDICFEKNIYLFVGRNKDNSFKVYYLEKNNSKQVASIKCDSFISCIYKKDINSFITGHLNGKLLEWKINYVQNTTNNFLLKKSIIKISDIFTIRSIFAHKSMICSINFNEKHNIILTTDLSGTLYIRKYYDFELLTKIVVNECNYCFINKVILNDYDIICCEIYNNFSKKFKLSLYSINGIILEESKYFLCLDFSLLKNGKIVFNKANSNYLYVFGFNSQLGKIKQYNILKDLDINKKTGDSIVRFILSDKTNFAYLLMESGQFFKKQNGKLDSLSFEVDKFLENN